MYEKALPLKAGDRIVVIAPSSPPPRGALQSGLSILEDMGFTVDNRALSSPSLGYLAGTDHDRAAVLSEALGDSSVSCIWAARGGFGATRILDRLVWPKRVHPPLILGFSDFSVVLHEALRCRGWVTFHAPNVTTLGQLTQDSLDACKSLLMGQAPGRYEGLSPLNPGRVTGRLMPLNLSMLMALAGTPHAPDLAGCILLLEDVHEPPYRLDRLFTQLSMLRGFGDLAGLVLGDFQGTLSDPCLRGNLLELLHRRGIPAVEGFPVGHGDTNHPVPMGIPAELDAQDGILLVLEDPFAPLFPG